MNSVGLSILTFTLFGTYLVSSETYAAPYPGTGSSALVAPEKGLFWARHGFQLSAGKTGWVINSENEHTTYRPLALSSAEFSVKVDKLKNDSSLETYAKKWMKDYSSYGFDLLGSQTFQQKDSKGLVVDFEHKKLYQQIRQIIFVRGKTAVILTCTDDRKTFHKSLESCNEISRSFSWLDFNLPKQN